MKNVFPFTMEGGKRGEHKIVELKRGEQREQMREEGSDKSR